MPTYSYSCRDCGSSFDIQQAFTDDSLTVCPTCGGRLRKLFSAVGVTFSGSGFYRTDSRASETKSREKSEKASEKKSEPAAASTPAPTSAPSSTPSSTPPAASSSASKAKE